MMIIKSEKIYIDYLDYSMSKPNYTIPPTERLRFDLLLFSEYTLCMSVPACVKLDSTTQLLMQLTPFWDNGKIQIILDNRHRSNPWNYFNNRNRVLEKGMSDFQLENHFEYRAYQSSHTRLFYNVYVKEVLQGNQTLYIGKVLDTDDQFRRAVIQQAEESLERFCPKFPYEVGSHMARIITDLILFAEDRNSLFQRSEVERRLVEECGATNYEVRIVGRILDRGFAYANGISSYAAPLSLITNRLTGKSFISILRSADMELYELIRSLDWAAVYRLSINDTWLDYIDHLNRLLIIYQDGKKHKDSVFPTSYISGSATTLNVIRKIYETAVESIRLELFKTGVPIIDVINVEGYTETLFEHYLRNKSEYLDIIKEINDLLPAIKVIIRSLDRKYKDSTILLQSKGFIVNL